MNAFDKIKKWMFGDETTARKRAERHQPKVSIGLATAESGDRQDDIDGLDVGGVIWPVEQGTHGGVSFISSQCFYATYDKKKKQVWLLDNETGTRHPGALPLIPGDTVFPVPDTGGRGLVIRTALFGNDGLKRNVFIPLNAKLEAHHEQPDPPINSSQVFDEDGRHGGLHYLTRVRLMATKLCPSATDKLSEVFAPMLNFTRNGDGTPAHGIATWCGSEGCLSEEAGGVLGPADDGNHILAHKSDGRKIHSTHTNRANALYGDRASGIIDSPKEFINEQWEPGAKDAFPGRVEEREDFKDFHINACGKRAPGKKKWMEWKPKAQPQEGEPKPKKPTTEPRVPVRVPEDGPPNIVPAMATIPAPPVTSQPTNTGPAEEEQPSLRGIARPDFDPPTGTGFDEAYSHGVGTQDEIWKRATGMTQREFFDLRRVSHDVAQGVAAMALPAGISSSPMLMKAYLQSTFVQDSKGQWYGRRGNAIGFQTLMPGGLEGHMAYKARHGALLTETKQLTRLLLNYKNAAGFEARTYLALGARLSTGDEVISGAEFYLDYSDDSDEPHLGIRFRDENGVITTAPKLKINGTTLSGLTGNEVTAASVLADNEVPKIDGASRAIQASGMFLNDSVFGLLVQHTTDVSSAAPSDTFSLRSGNNAGVGNSGDASLRSGTANTGNSGDVIVDAGPGVAANGAAYFGATNADAVYIGRSGKNTKVGGTLSMAEQAAPSTPASGTVVIYPKADGLIYSKDDAGTETQLGGGGSGTTLGVVMGMMAHSSM